MIEFWENCLEKARKGDKISDQTNKKGVDQVYISGGKYKFRDFLNKST